MGKNETGWDVLEGFQSHLSDASRERANLYVFRVFAFPYSSPISAMHGASGDLAVWEEAVARTLPILPIYIVR